MNYTKTMPEAALDRFLITCREIDDLTDQMNQTPRDPASVQFLYQQIAALRSVRDDIAGTYAWAPAAS